MKSFELIELDNRHKGKKFFKYRIEFLPQWDEKESPVERFADMYLWFTKQYGLGYDYNTWMHLAKYRSNKLNPYWCFDLDPAGSARYIYIWNDDMLTMFNLVYGGNDG